jgi:hypothetical protein
VAYRIKEGTLREHVLEMPDETINKTAYCRYCQDNVDQLKFLFHERVFYAPHPKSLSCSFASERGRGP